MTISVWVGVIYVCLGVECYFLKSPTTFETFEECQESVVNLSEELNANPQMFANGTCFDVDIGVEI